MYVTSSSKDRNKNIYLKIPSIIKNDIKQQDSDYNRHTRSRSHISIAGSIEPTAIKFPANVKTKDRTIIRFQGYDQILSN